MLIDAHIHVAPPKLPGVSPMPVLLRSPEEVASAVREQMADSEATTVLAMGRFGATDEDPLGIATTLKIAEHVPGLFAIGAVDPRRTEPEHLQRVDRELAWGRVKALKAYLGYLHRGPDDAGYRPYYELAQRFRLPVYFHTGDTHSPQAKLKYAHPLLVDDIAVDFPDVRFVLAHLGFPWLNDAAEVIYKNVNVWGDLSGLIVGGEAAFADEERKDQLNDLRAALWQAFRCAERPNRFIYGSDWPMAPMAAYRNFVAGAIPAAYQEPIFVENARLLFGFTG
jgi:uncharacterized protein